MSRPIAAFLDEVVQYLEAEVLPDAYTESRYFDNCETRVDLENEQVKIRHLAHCARTRDRATIRVNEVLSRSEIRLRFQFHGKQVTGSWTEALVQCTIGLHLPDVSTPPVLKWEERGDTYGALKADEWFDHDREYIAEEITAKHGIKRGIREHFETTVPSFQSRFTVSEVAPRLVQVLFNDDHEILEELDPIRVG